MGKLTRKEFQKRIEELYHKWYKQIVKDARRPYTEYDKWSEFECFKVCREIDKLQKQNPKFEADYTFYYDTDLFKKLTNASTRLDNKKQKYEESLCKDPKPKNSQRVDDTFELQGDIIITDPGYIHKWVDCEHSRSTIYGDWSCKAYTKNEDGKHIIIGDFCADGGEVCVENIDVKDKKEIEQWVKEHNWCATIIRNFKGKIKYIIKNTWYPYEAKWCCDTSLIIRGIGKKDGKKFTFTTYQSGF